MPDFQPAFCANNDLTIKPDWIDYNDHLNMGYYTVLFDQASDAVFQALGLGPEYLKTRGMTFYTVECHIRYLKELKLGDAVSATFQLIHHDQKRIHAAQHLYHKKGWLAATAEMLWLHVDQTAGAGETPKVVPFPSDVKANLETLANAQNNLKNQILLAKPSGHDHETLKRALPNCTSMGRAQFRALLSRSPNHRVDFSAMHWCCGW